MKFKPLFLIFFALAFLVCGCSPIRAEQPEENNVWDDSHIAEENHDDHPADNSDNELAETKTLKGAWIATAWNIDFPGSATKSSVKLKQEIDAMVSKANACGLNALFFQVRPCADSLYPSSLFPWSKFLTGAQGTAPDSQFDPLDYIIRQCHANGIELHAWINPFRVTASTTDKLTSAHPASKNPELTFKVNDKMYFNPGEPAARRLILDGVREILLNYDVDGIHFDDYFYPEGIKDEDSQAFQNYGGGFKTVADFRRNCVDEVIRETYRTVQELKPNAAFGVSPPGIWANKSSNPLGSDTRGFESYYSIYADSRGWVKKGYVDYIAPQIYWYMGQSGSDFNIVLNWWNAVCQDTDVLLLTGIAGYKAGTGGAWNDSSEFDNQMQLAAERGNGYLIFSFSNLSA